MRAKIGRRAKLCIAAVTAAAFAASGALPIYADTSLYTYNSAISSSAAVEAEAETPPQYKFTLDKNVRTSENVQEYILLDYYDSDGERQYFVMTEYCLPPGIASAEEDISLETSYGSGVYRFCASDSGFDWNGDGKYYWDKLQNGSPAHFLNTDAVEDAAIDESMQPYVRENTWKFEQSKNAEYKNKQYEYTAKYSDLAWSEYYGQKLYKKIGYSGKVLGGYAKNYFWWLRSAEASGDSPKGRAWGIRSNGYNGNPNGSAVMLGTDRADSCSHRPCFYLSEEFFKNVKLDVSSMGSEVKSLFLSRIGMQTAKNVGYTERELSEIGYTPLYSDPAEGVRTADGGCYIRKCVFNSDSKEHNASLITVLRKNGKIERVNVDKRTVSGGAAAPLDTEADLSGGVSEDTEVDLYIWDENMRPYCLPEKTTVGALVQPRAAYSDLSAAEADISGFDFVRQSGGANVETLGGKNCWVMRKTENMTDNLTIWLKLSPYMADECVSGSIYTLTVEYYDPYVTEEDGTKRADAGYFKVFYNAAETGRTEAETVYLNNAPLEESNCYKTAVITLKDAVMNGGLDGYDLELAAKGTSTQNAVSQIYAGIKSVKLTKGAVDSFVYPTAVSHESGNAYEWYKSEKTVQNRFANLTNLETSLTVTYMLTDAEDNTVYSQTENKILGGGETLDTVFDFGDFKECGVYKYKLVTETENSAGVRRDEREMLNIAVLKSDPNGILNKYVYINAHLNRYSGDEKLADAVDVLKKGNTGGVRVVISWASMEKPGCELDWNNHISYKAVQALHDGGFKILGLMMSMSAKYTDGQSTNIIPTTDKQLDAWRKYAFYSAETLKEYGVEEFEIWNEPNCCTFSQNAYNNAAAYTIAARAAAEEIKKANPNAQVGAGSLTWLGSTGESPENSATVYYGGKSFMTDVAAAGLWNDSNIDAITLHPYAGVNGPEADISADEKVLWYKAKALEDGREDILIWNTEIGYSSAQVTELQKGIFNSRQDILMRSHGASNRVMYYNFEKKGTIETDREDQFGMVSGDYADSDNRGKCWIPTISYVIYAAHNYIMADTEFEGLYDTDGGNIRMSLFKSNKQSAALNGKKILTLYRVGENKRVTLSLGCESIVCYDCFGNERVMSAADGIYEFEADERPQYIVGDFTGVAVNA
ncbi:MAG: hypothetical protein ACI4DY_03620, partial [Monoglobaceae bacterium]